ncbi:hypothetical protein V6N12_029835 [Hibiscus sabdariffa]|uniref:Uncharacterized protein n=1 Tax=Hibiscus sabdariffa TaxID=183260 RepID=A0ABR2CXC3_9ROSI
MISVTDDSSSGSTADDDRLEKSKNAENLTAGEVEAMLKPVESRSVAENSADGMVADSLGKSEGGINVKRTKLMNYQEKPSIFIGIENQVNDRNGNSEFPDLGGRVFLEKECNEVEKTFDRANMDVRGLRCTTVNINPINDEMGINDSGETSVPIVSKFDNATNKIGGAVVLCADPLEQVQCSNLDLGSSESADSRALEDVCSMGLVEMTPLKANCLWAQKVDQLNNFQLVDSTVLSVGNGPSLDEGLMGASNTLAKNLMFENLEMGPNNNPGSGEYEGSLEEARETSNSDQNHLFEEMHDVRRRGKKFKSMFEMQDKVLSDLERKKRDRAMKKQNKKMYKKGRGVVH